jgi:hypothetical protein
VLPLTEALPPTRILCLRLKDYPMRPAVAAFEAFVCEAFAAGGMFAPGSITPPRVDAVERLAT